MVSNKSKKLISITLALSFVLVLSQCQDLKHMFTKCEICHNKKMNKVELCLWAQKDSLDTVHIFFEKGLHNIYCMTPSIFEKHLNVYICRYSSTINLHMDFGGGVTVFNF